MNENCNNNFRVLLFYKYVEVSNPEAIVNEQLEWALPTILKEGFSLPKKV